jgi:nucleoside-triphosphatase THEP1
MGAGVLIIHGERGSGKTSRTRDFVEKARSKGYTIRGVLSERILENGETIGYDCLDLGPGDNFPLVRLRNRVDSDEWELFGNLIFAFNRTGFRRANRLLKTAAMKMDDNTLIIVDEYGHLEKGKQGLYPGLLEVINSLDKGGRLIILCRTDKIDPLLGLLTGIKILLMESDRDDFWESLGDSFI